MGESGRLNECTQAVVRLQVAWTKRDSGGALQALRDLYATNPRAMVHKCTAPEREVYRQIFEGVDDVLQQWWLADDEKQGLWRQLLLPGRHGFGLGSVIENAVWLRFVESEIVDQVAPLPTPAELGQLPWTQQAKVLGRFCVRCDSTTPIDYAAVAECIDPRLRPFFAHWLLRAYLASPQLFIFEEANDNRRRAMRSFSEYHEDALVEVPFNPLMGSAGYRAAYADDEVRTFVERLVATAMEPAIAKRLRLTQPALSPEVSSREGGRGLFYSCWGHAHAVYRCMSPLLEGIRSPELRGYVLEPDSAQSLERVAPAWRAGEVDIVAVDTPHNDLGILQTVQTIAEDDLDFLFYPEVGLLLATRWGSTQRLARVQATGYGHPRTTGSAHMDYFIGGASIESDPAQYTERLVLLPGLGVGTTVPPEALTERERPLDDERVLLFNQSSFDKLNAPLLQTWGRILRGHSEASLEFYPAFNEAEAIQHGDRLHALLDGGDALLVPVVPRQKIIDRLVEADLYLDSFPFGGFNTLVEVLAAGCPVVTLEGRSAQSRFGAAMLRRLGLPEFLIARDFEQYERAASRLIQDSKLRLEIRAMLERDRVLSVLQDDALGAHFAAAVEWMEAEGPRSDDLRPVYIEAGQPARILDDALPLAG